MNPQRRNLNPEDLFWSKVALIPFHSCWEWTGFINPSGYGTFSRLAALAHRASWILHFGKIPNGLFVLHSCDNRRCVRPDHLFLGTNKDNMRDMVLKGRQNKAKGSRNSQSKLSEKDVLRIRASIKPVSITAKKYGVTVQTIYLILRRDIWKHI